MRYSRKLSYVFTYQFSGFLIPGRTSSGDIYLFVDLDTVPEFNIICREYDYLDTSAQVFDIVVNGSGDRKSNQDEALKAIIDLLPKIK